MFFIREKYFFKDNLQVGSSLGNCNKYEITFGVIFQSQDNCEKINIS